MTNKEIAKPFRVLAKVMEYLGENTFKIRSYSKAYDIIRKHEEPLLSKTAEELQALDGIGKAISLKIREIIDTGSLPLLNRYLDDIPSIVLEMLEVRGLGIKKIKQLVEELKPEGIGELVHACQENRIAKLKGWSTKTQQTLQNQLNYYLQSKGKSRYADLVPTVDAVLKHFAEAKITVTGAYRRQLPIIESLEFVALDTITEALLELDFKSQKENWWSGVFEETNISIRLCKAEDFVDTLVKTTGSSAFLERQAKLKNSHGATEEEYFKNAGLDYISPPQREAIYDHFTPEQNIIQTTDIQGVVHAHTDYSDGAATVEKLAKTCKKAGYSYLTITDHSKVAVYANGLSIERLHAQFKEIEEVNQKLKDFTIFAGSEVDILKDGSLDYDDDTLAALDIVIASIHSILRMSKEDATARILKAIENPYTNMLGHPTGRLLLSREGYPLDMDAVIDACAKYNVAIEINANPYRLDLDWQYLRKAKDRGVLLSINPDAHSLSDIEFIKYGVLVAQKAGLEKDDFINTRDTAGFASWIKAQKAKRPVVA